MKQSEQKVIKKSVTIPKSIILFSIFASLFLLTLVWHFSKLTNVVFINATITTTLLLIAIRWAELGENMLETVITVLTKKYDPSKKIKRKFNFNSVIFSAAITIGFCNTNTLPINIKWAMIIGLSLLFVCKFYIGTISRYRSAILMKNNLK